MKVDIYRNIGPQYKGLGRKVYSVRSRRPGATYGTVENHMAYGKANACEFVVSEAGRRRVVEQGQKEIHGVVRSDDFHFQVVEGDFGRYWKWNEWHEQFEPYQRGVDFDPDFDIIGNFMQIMKRKGHDVVRVTYDPYKFTQFVDRDQTRPVMGAEKVLFFPQDVVAVNPSYGNFSPLA